MLLERVPDELESIGEDADVLTDFKYHASLETNPDWTEADSLIKTMLLSAEAMIDGLSSAPYRTRTWIMSLDDLEWCCHKRLYLFKFPVRPLTEDLVTVDWKDRNGDTGTYTEVTDFTVYGRNSLSPEAYFPVGFRRPWTHQVPYPYTVSFKNAAQTALQGPAQLAIFELAAYYFRNPEAMSDKQPNAGKIFQANLDILKAGML